MPDSDAPNSHQFFDQFLADYLVESEEHLTALRQELLALEHFVGKPQIDEALLDELFRRCHTLKGISGMVGLAEAEQVAHRMESYLRVLRQGQLPLSEHGLESLIASVRLLEQIIEARRSNAALPDITSVIAELSRLSQNTDSDHGVAPTAKPPMQRATGQGVRLWRFEFMPSRELVERGINVNTARARLQEIGEIRRSVPLVKAQGQIAFGFVVASSADESVFAGWRDDGLEYAAVDAGSEVTPSDEALLEQQPAAGLPRATSNVVRVDLTRLDDLMSLVGDLVMSRARLENRIKQLRTVLDAPEWRPLQETSSLMERQLRDLRHAVMRVRMVQIGEIFERMRFVIRDLARENRKKVALDVSGQNTEIDKFVVERMMDPLLHLVRNAVSHGLESSEERLRSGKSAEGLIRLRARTAGERVIIEIEDDGRGIDVEKVEQRARERGLIAPGTHIDDDTLLDIITAPTFSTQDKANRESGRGVGLDVVKNSVEELKASISLWTERGRGTRFSIHLPLTLAIADVLLALVEGQTFAVPQAAVQEIIEVEPQAVSVLENNEVISYRGGVLPLVRLAKVFRLAANGGGRSFHVFVIGSGPNAAGLVVDRVIGQREVVVRAASDPLLQVPGISGATEIGDGRVVLILNVEKLLLPAAEYEQRLSG
ncbi:MAG: chemotaxis protein CheA [Acidobacteria bacterium]|nr:chemotaxis protein CheA [Acidobacteriota bacterium]